MARKPVPGSRMSHADIVEEEDAYDEEIPYRRSTPPPSPAIKTGPAPSQEQIELRSDPPPMPPYAACQAGTQFDNDP